MKQGIYAIVFLLAMAGCKTKKPAGGGTQKKVYYTNNFVTAFSFEYNNRLISFFASVNEGANKFRFILDSGAPTFITDTVVKQHRIASAEQATAFDVNGNEQPVNIYHLRNIVIGGREFRHISAAGSEQTSGMAVLKNRAEGGLIGADVMKEGIWMIDYHKRSITLTDRIDSLNIPAGSFTAKMHKGENGSPVIEAVLPGNRKMSFIIDLGYNGSLLLPYNRMNEELFNDSLGYVKNEIVNAGIKSSVQQQQYRYIKTFKSGTIELENVKASTTGNNTKALIGNEFLEHYIVVLDFVNRGLTLIPQCTDDLCIA
jgi:hypothetical protein